MHLRLGTVGIEVPAMALDFVSAPVLSSAVTFSRSSAATTVGQDGLIQTVAVDAPRFDFDPTSLAPRGLLIEESRTNMFVNSLVNGVSLATQNVSVTAVPHTISFYGTGTITLSGAAVSAVVGTGAYPNRQTLTFTPILGVLVCTVVGLVQFAQLEVGSFATSFIPTAATPVTRAADIATMTGSNFSSWYNQTEGTFVVSYDMLWTGVASATYGVLGMDSSASKRVVQMQGGSTSPSVRDASSNLPTANSVIAGVNKAASGYDATIKCIVLNGGAVASDAVAAGYSASSSLNIGSIGAGSPLNGHIRQIAYYNRRLPNSVLQRLTS